MYIDPYDEDTGENDVELYAPTFEYSPVSEEEHEKGLESLRFDRPEFEYSPYTAGENNEDISPAFVKKTFVSMSERYRLVGLQVLEVEYDDPTNKKNGWATKGKDLGSGISQLITPFPGPDYGCLDPIQERRDPTGECRGPAWGKILFSYDTPPLLESECHILAQLFVEHCFFERKAFKTSIELAHDPNTGLYYGGNLLDVCTVSIELEYPRFAKFGIASEFLPSSFDIPYVAGPNDLYLIIVPESGSKSFLKQSDGFFDVSSYGSITSKYGITAIEKMKSFIQKMEFCQGLVLDNRPEILKAVLHETDDEKRNRLFYEKQQKNSWLSQDEIGKMVAQELGRPESFSEGTVRIGIKAHKKYLEKQGLGAPHEKLRRGRKRKS